MNTIINNKTDLPFSTVMNMVLTAHYKAMSINHPHCFVKLRFCVDYYIINVKKLKKYYSYTIIKSEQNEKTV